MTHINHPNVSNLAWMYFHQKEILGMFKPGRLFQASVSITSKPPLVLKNIPEGPEQINVITSTALNTWTGKNMQLTWLN